MTTLFTLIGLSLSWAGITITVSLVADWQEARRQRTERPTVQAAIGRTLVRETVRYVVIVHEDDTFRGHERTELARIVQN